MNLQDYAQQIDQWFLAHEEEMLNRLETIVNMNSFSLDGDDVDSLGMLLCSWIEEAGFTTEKMPKEKSFNHDESMTWMEKLGHVYTARSHPKEQGDGIVFSGHLDTVFPKDSMWPFRIDKENDKAFGPGVNDMKAGLLVNIYVAKCLKELNLINVPMTLTFSPDEELGSPTTCPVLKKELTNAYAVLCTEPGFLNGGVTCERKGSGHFRLEIEGVSAHAGRAFADGKSAILELFHKALAYDKYVDLPNDQTVNTGLISGGSSANSVAGNATASIHITYKTLEQGEKLVQSIRAETEKNHIEGTKSKISGGIALPPLVPTESTNFLFTFAENAGKAINYPIFSQPSKGAAESGFCSSVLGIPSICSMGPEGEFLHSKDEYLILSSIIPKCKVVALTAIQVAEKFNKAI